MSSPIVIPSVFVGTEKATVTLDGNEMQIQIGKSQSPITIYRKDFEEATWIVYGQQCNLQLFANNRFYTISSLPPDKHSAFEQFFSPMPLKALNASIMGQNFGAINFHEKTLSLDAQDGPIFTIPYRCISNTQAVTSKEDDLTLSLNTDPESTGDQLAHIRLYIPKDHPHAATDYMRDISSRTSQNVISSSIAKINNIKLLRPKGTCVMQFCDDQIFFQSTDKFSIHVLYNQISLVQFLKKAGGDDEYLVIGLKQSVRVGQTDYSFLVALVSTTEDANLVGIQQDWKENEAVKQLLDQAGRIKPKSDEGMFETTDEDRYAGVHCSMKASNGSLYLMRDCLFFLMTPVTYIPYSKIKGVKFEGIDPANLNSRRSFDLKFTNDQNKEITFSGIKIDELSSIESFLKGVNITITNPDEVRTYMRLLISKSKTGERRGKIEGLLKTRKEIQALKKMDRELDLDDDDEEEDQDFNPNAQLEEEDRTELPEEEEEESSEDKKDDSKESNDDDDSE